ncbi:V-type ATP synthase subunit D [Planctomycetota bacterium]
MARRIAFTKDELQRQQRELSKFKRFLPTLILKKRQLQIEIRKLLHEARAKRLELGERLEEIREWIGVFATRDAQDWRRAVQVGEVVTRRRIIAGVPVPELDSVRFDIEPYSLMGSDPTVDRAITTFCELLEEKAAIQVLLDAVEVLRRELQRTTQRVNLFERIMIPRTEENVRTIKIYLEDQDRSAVGRAKIAKRRLQGAVREPARAAAGAAPAGGGL